MPQTGTVPLVADMSSNILSERYDISKFGIIYAGAQKNIGPAGLTVVIVRNDLYDHPLEWAPTMLRYATHVEKGSMFNTPPCYAIYIAKLVFEYLLERGGVGEIERENRAKAALLYDFIDNSELYSAPVAGKDRSRMNVPFLLPSDELSAEFIGAAKTNGLVNLKGHRSVGGMRASIYNAMPMEGVTTLVDFMKKFERDHR
jgi:phosphoserine aminotransferase